MKFIALLLLVFAAFPYIKFFGVGLSSDVQLYAVIMSCIVIFMNIVTFRTVEKNFLKQLYVLLAGVIWLWILYVGDGGGVYNFFRGIYPYISLFLVTWAMLYIVRFEALERSTIEKFLKLCYWLWVVVGSIQLVKHDFLIGWRERTVLSDDRGSISLASEPSYFTITLILMSLILILLNSSNMHYFYVNIVVAVLVAQNAVGVFYSVLILAIWGFDFKNMTSYLKLILFGVFIAVFTYFMTTMENRLGHVLHLLLTDPLYLMKNDGSLSIRFAHLFIGIKGFIENNFLPNGVTNWGSYYYHNYTQYPELFFNRGVQKLDFHKINSVHASLLYELGLFAFFLYAAFWNMCKKNNDLIQLFIIVMIMGFNGLNISHPLFSMLLALMIYRASEAVVAEREKPIRAYEEVHRWAYVK